MTAPKKSAVAKPITKPTTRKVTKSATAKATAGTVSDIKPGDEDYVDYNENALHKPSESVLEPPTLHAKHLTLMVSIGATDRERLIEDFEAAIVEAINTVDEKIRVTKAGTYYILDGKVCLPDDYDVKTQNFKPGAKPPQWASGNGVPGRTVAPVKISTTPEREYISREEADRRIAAAKAKRESQAGYEDNDDYAVLEWTEDDVNDETLTAIADTAKTVETAVGSSKKRRIVRKVKK